ncbi:hypothetical protein ABB37_05200 [Leptomonas pyrrhocoris]|uniref:FYVE-type domain-containing protein n=1 Tax=Leptomonas pyrrhocoris TaxID=157538 RepID=A0A0M9G1F3_LEPPY|nr:hypothetical protein ABB37_05200 [Leptomonas pyrrhocoris]KPA80229.1 hypothetical protein ABB37_05200 [Leptomonas pyrrhocoris]|eukprot:XP_015658668.1 hypothetical protein ABB37_05200 [Leptomonas pyrrhocoris]
MSASSQKCAVCGRPFGMLLWKHTCDVCHRTVCDDCAPRNTESIGPNGEATKLRVCKSCGTAGRRLGGSTADNDATANKKDGGAGPVPTTVPRPDPNSEEERARRTAIIEARNRSQQTRGCPRAVDSAGQRATPVSPTLPAPSPPPAPTNDSNSPAATATLSSTSPVAATTQETPSATMTPPAPLSPSAVTSAGRPTNPALEAALRRQQQQQARSGAAAAARVANTSPEKMRLLREIDALLAKHHEEPPFGLRASDEAKLKSYLQYLKAKYHESE